MPGGQDGVWLHIHIKELTTVVSVNLKIHCSCRHDPSLAPKNGFNSNRGCNGSALPLDQVQHVNNAGGGARDRGLPRELDPLDVIKYVVGCWQIPNKKAI